MASAVVGALRITLGLDSAQFTQGLTAAQRGLQSAGQRLQSVGAGMAKVGAGMTAAITLPMVALGRSAMQAATEHSEAMGQMQAALASMGPVAGRTSDQLQRAALALEGVSSFNADDILRKVTANLLTFGNVAGESFDRAQQAAIDLSARLGQDLQASTLMVGKALNDPIRGLAALRRVGIQFTADQEAQIKAMQGVGDTAGAQAIMLAELERQFGGAAKAARDAAPGSDTVDAWREFKRTIGAIIMDALPPLTNMLTGVLKAFNDLSPGVKGAVVAVAAVAAALGPLLVVMGAVVSAIGVLLPLVGAISAPFLVVAAAVAAVGVAFYVFRDDIIPVLKSFSASVVENIGPKLAPLWDALKGAVAAIGEVFNAIFGDGSPGGATEALKVFGEIVSRVFGAAIDVITGAINVVTNILKALGALLRGDFSAMWGYLGQAVMSAVRGIANAFQTLFPEVVSWVRQTYEGVKEWLLDRFTSIVRGVGEKVEQVKGFFKGLWDAVVGHSYIPDMVIAIADWMGPRLQEAMVDPALAAVNETASAFDGMAADVGSTMESLFQSIASKDWKGALGSILDIFSGQGGMLGSIGKIGQAIMGAFPGFKTGGSFTVGGSGGPDSQLMAFRATPGEMVDIRRPGQDLGAGGGQLIHVEPSKYFDVRVQEVATPLASGAYQASRATVPADMARTSRYTRGRR